MPFILHRNVCILRLQFVCASCARSLCAAYLIFVCIMRPQFESPDIFGGPATAMAQRLWDDPEENPEWVLKLKHRQPRHQAEEERFWFLDKEHKAGLRWAAAEHYMESERSAGHRMKMAEVVDQIRQDLSLARVCWMPHKWTTMIQGRPVQAQ